MLASAATVALLAAAVVLGVVAHELSHVLVLRVFGVGTTVEVLPDRDDDQQLAAGMGGHLAQVSIVRPDDVAPQVLRIAALMPLVLTVPLVLVLTGSLPNPFVTGSAGAKLVVIAWMACSIPSPQDFSLAWYPERALAAARERASRSPGDASLG